MNELLLGSSSSGFGDSFRERITSTKVHDVRRALVPETGAYQEGMRRVTTEESIKQKTSSR
jgi:hypothetical protein